MSGAQKEDRLEEFFRSRLERYEEDPQEGMWGRISGSIPPRPAAPWWATIKGWLWPGSMALLLLALIAVLWQSRQLHDLSLRLEEQSLLLENIREEILSEEGRIESSNVKNPEIEEEAGAHTSNPKGEYSVGKTLINIAPTKQEGKGFYEDEENNQSIKEGIDRDIDKTADALKIEEEELHASSFPDAPASAMNLLRPVPGLNLKLLETGADDEMIIPREESARNYPHFFYSLFYEPGYTRFPGVPYGVWAGSGVNSSGSTAGLSAGLQLGPKVSIQTGAAFKTVLFRIDESAALNYTAENATPDAEGRPTRWYDMETSEGVFQIRSQIVNQPGNDGNDISEGDPFQLSLDVRYRLRYFSIPLWARYELGGNRWKVYLKGGGVAHLLTGDKTRILKAATSFDRLSSGRMTVQVKGLGDVFLEAGAGPGLTYEWTPRINLGMEAIFYHALTPIAFDPGWSLGFNFNLNFKL